MDRKKQNRHTKVALLIGVAVLFCYFFSEAVLRQFVLHRAGTQSINLSSILGKLPPGLRDEVTRRITIAELKDELKAAKTSGEKIRISINLATVISPEELQKQYAEIIDKYPKQPESLPAFTNFLMAPDAALKSISISQYQQFIKVLNKEQRFWAWNSGFSKLKSLKISAEKQIVFLSPLLKIKPEGREYQQIYTELSELAFEEKNQDIELKAKKLQEVCEKLPYFDEVLEKRAKAKAKAKAKAAKLAEEKNKSTEREK
ncbi:MAG: hypothetical protein KAS17_08740 [Victivallaceae bacterium]|nr:hypothetical protein [Victivallaceae bacterium]